MQPSYPVGSAPTPPPARPHDVDTAFWLWVAAVPLMVTGYLIDLFDAVARPPALVIALSLLFLVALTGVVVAFLILMRQGYRWTRTLLTGGAITSVVYSATKLFTAERHPMAATGYAAAVIVGSVMIAGGAYLLHRKDAHEFFNR
ncbi:MAG: hypothetical protein AB7F42_32385 [Mycolicibacterium sp.]